MFVVFLLWSWPYLNENRKSSQIGYWFLQNELAQLHFFQQLAKNARSKRFLLWECVLYQQSPTPVFCCCSPFSSHSFQSTHRFHCLSRVLFLSTFWASALSSPIFHLLFCPHVRSISTIYWSSFFLKLSFTPTSWLSVRPSFFYPLSSLPRFFLSSCFRKPATECE